MILNIHGYMSSGRNSKYEWLAANAAGHEIVSPTIDYDRREPGDILRELGSSLVGADDETTYIVGMSLGGFFASLLHASRPRVRTILINPCLLPFLMMRRLGAPDAAMRMYFELFRGLFERATSGEPDERLHVICGDADEDIDHGELTLPILPKGARAYTIEGGAHRMPVAGKFAEIMRELIV